MARSVDHGRTAGGVLVLLLAALALLLAACGSAGTASRQDGTGTASVAFPLQVSDDSGMTLTFREGARRVISYSPGVTEILYAIGAGDRLVATDRFSDYPPQAGALPKLEYSRPAPEPALALKPDLVIMAGRQEGQVEQFRAAGMNVLLLREPKDLAGVVTHVRLLGRITDRQESAESLAADMERRIEAARRKVAGIEKGPLVFYELSPDGYTVAPDSFVGSLLSLLKAGNVAQGATTPFPQLSAEVIIKANPDVILLSDAGAWGGQSLETVKARPGWAGIKAVQNGRVYEIDPDIFNRPGPRVVEALELLVTLLYPGL